MVNIVLASKSIDRRKILKRLDIPFKTLVTDIDEEKYKMNIFNPIKLVRKLAKTKVLYGKKILLKKRGNAVIIAADTVVEFNREIIGKVDSENEAYKVLKKLSGNVHNLITGIAVTETNSPKLIIDSDITIVELNKLSKNDIWSYIKTEEWIGRAGAYSINDKASLFIKKIIGSNSNVVGLPMQKLYNILKDEFGVNLLQLG